jgi:hypothetical protein
MFSNHRGLVDSSGTGITGPNVSILGKLHAPPESSAALASRS